MVARNVQRGDLLMACCHGCGFVWNQAFDANLTAYEQDYDTSEPNSAAYSSHVEGLLQDLLVHHGAGTKRIVEVGCGKGFFLRELVKRGTNSTGVGFDPSYVGPPEDLGGRLRFERAFYGPDCASEPADLVICRHVIEHVADPLALLTLLRRVLQGSQETRVFFETPTVEWIARNCVVWDFFYEHCSLFTAETLSFAFQKAGFKVETVKHIFGGQYLWIEAIVGRQPEAIDPPQEYPKFLLRLAQRYAIAEPQLLQRWRDRLESLKRQGGLALWGGAAKGVTLANLVDPDRSLIDCIVDVNPNKRGSFVPGTGHPIIGFDQIGYYPVKNVLVTNPNYEPEIRRLIARAGSDLVIHLD